MIAKLLKEKELPPLGSREDMLAVLLREEYGQIPDAPDALTFREGKAPFGNAFAGKAVAGHVTAVCTLGGREFSFPFEYAIPKKAGKHPFFVHINFRAGIVDRYMPTEELLDRGYAVFALCYGDVTSDDGDWGNGLSAILYPDGHRPKEGAGKIAMWAWAASRVLDYAYTRAECLDLDRATVCGHSRLGKTALLAAATDRRFACAYSNDSGCSGAAITRGKQGESVRDIVNRFPYWFCENYAAYADREAAMPFDQHYLAAAIAPRLVCVGSASEDLWADPLAEQLTCHAASPAFERIGVQGFCAPDRQARVGESFFDGRIGYHLREGLHYFSRSDWLQLLTFLEKHEEK